MKNSYWTKAPLRIGHVHRWQSYCDFIKQNKLFWLSRKKFLLESFVNVQNNFVSGTLKPTKYVTGNLTGFIKEQR